MAVPSAQVKSAIVLAALTANGATTIVEPQPSRDHTERMLDLEIETSGSGQRTIVVHPVTHLLAVDTMLPGDISSAAFFVVAASIVADSRIVIEHVGINPTRTGFLDVLERAGARISLSNKSSTRGEWVADIVVESAQLESLTITRGIVPRLIDEIPVLAIAAARANGLSRFDGIGELRAKESDRLDAIGAHLTAFGVPFTDGQDWLEVSGHSPIRSATVAAYHDHRMAMSAAIAGLVAAGPVTVKDAEVASVSFPDFYEILDSLSR